MSSTTGEWQREKREMGGRGGAKTAQTGCGIMKRKWRCAEPKDEVRWGLVIHTHWCPFGGFSQAEKHERAMTTRPHCERALSPSLYGKVKDPQSSPRWSFCPGVHHTSRKRELLDLAWKGSDHIRRRSPWKQHTCQNKVHSPLKLSFGSQRQKGISLGVSTFR